MHIVQPDWLALAIFSTNVLALAVFGLTVAGHFPREHRVEALRRGVGAAVLWASTAVSCIAAVAAFRMALALPIYSAILAGGFALLFAPLVLKLMPDSFVDGYAGLLVFFTRGSGHRCKRALALMT